MASAVASLCVRQPEMISCTSARYLVDLLCKQTAQGRDPCGNRGAGPFRWLATWLGLTQHRLPETAEMALARLAATSPHLLHDIGVQVTQVARRGTAALGHGTVVVVHLPQQVEAAAQQPAPALIPAITAE